MSLNSIGYIIMSYFGCNDLQLVRPTITFKRPKCRKNCPALVLYEGVNNCDFDDNTEDKQSQLVRGAVAGIADASGRSAVDICRHSAAAACFIARHTAQEMKRRQLCTLTNIETFASFQLPEPVHVAREGSIGR